MTMLADQFKREIEKVEPKARQAFKDFTDARDAAIAEGANVTDQGSEEFQKLHALNQKHGEYQTELKRLTDDYLAAVKMDAAGNGGMGELGRMVAENGGQSLSDPAMAQAVAKAAAFEMFAQRILKTDDMKQVQDLLKRSENAKIGGTKYLGEAMNRQELKAALVTGGGATSGGAFIENDRQGYFGLPDREMSLLQMVTTGQTDSDTVEYVRQTTRPTSAAFVAEATDTSGGNGVKPEGTIAFELVTETVKTIAELIPVTRQAFKDAGQLQTIIENGLLYDLQDELETKMASGAGGASFTGIYNTSGIQTYARGGGESYADALHKAYTLCLIANYQPDGIGMHPNDWQDLRLQKDSAGNYIFGPPNSVGPKQAWGLPVTVSTSFTEGTPVVGAFRRGATLWLREGAVIHVTDSHSDWFKLNILALLAEMRAAFGVTLPSAFCTVTNF